VLCHLFIRQPIPLHLVRARGRRLALLYNLSQTFNSSLDLNEVLNRVIDE